MSEALPRFDYQRLDAYKVAREALPPLFASDAELRCHGIIGCGLSESE
jgi:hypothetical protein